MNPKSFFKCVTVFSTSALFALASAGVAADKPNIVLINMDNFGYGELGVYGGGITRGGATPRIDKLASEGLRLTNFNVEAQCTPSRAALMTGRYAKRSGNASVPWLTGLYGLTQWEVTIAEVLHEAGYATGIFGKWHLGHTAGRFPTDQGFDEWYGIPNSTDESFWPAQAQFNRAAAEKTAPFLEAEYIYKSTKGVLPEKIKLYDSEARREIDREITDHTKAFIERQVSSEKPFFAYVPYTLTHMPVTPSTEYTGKSGNGHWGDVLMQIDAYTGEILDTLERLGVADNTIFIFTADNGPEMLPGHQGWGGPWSGSYFTAKEGSLRVPFILRWPGRVPAGAISNEIVHQMDLFTTLTLITKARLPTDRIIDGVDQREFFIGNSSDSSREGFVVYVGEEIFGVKWRNWKMLTSEFNDDRGTGTIVKYGVPHFYNLYNDPKEDYPVTMKTPEHLWVRWPMAKILGDHLASFESEAPIKPGTPDPYTPPGGS